MEHDLDHAQVRIPPLVLLGHLTAALLIGWLIRLPVPLPFLLRLLGVLIILAGLGLAWAAARAMAAAHTLLDPYQLRRKTTAFRHVDTPHLRWVQVQAAPPKGEAS